MPVPLHKVILSEYRRMLKERAKNPGNVKSNHPALKKLGLEFSIDPKWGCYFHIPRKLDLTWLITHARRKSTPVSEYEFQRAWAKNKNIGLTKEQVRKLVKLAYKETHDHEDEAHRIKLGGRPIRVSIETIKDEHEKIGRIIYSKVTGLNRHTPLATVQLVKKEGESHYVSINPTDRVPAFIRHFFGGEEEEGFEEFRLLPPAKTS